MLINDECLEDYDNGRINFLNVEERYLASEISYYRHKYNNKKTADFYTYLNDKEDLKKVFDRVVDLDLVEEVESSDLKAYIDTLKEFQIKQEIEKLKNKIKEEPDMQKQIEIANRIRELKNNS